MKLSRPPAPAVLAASLAIILVPAFAQSRASDTTDQNSPYHGTVVEDIIARVNDQVISKSDYERAEQELEQEARQQGWNQQQLYEQRRDLLRSLIDNQLLLSKGKELGITGETETIKRLDEIRKQNHLDSMEALQKAAEAQGVSFEDFKEQIRENVIRSEVISQEVGQHITVAPSEIQHYYDTHQQEFERPEQVRLSEILIPTANPDDATQVADAEKKAEAIEARLKSGADFATVAKADSGGPTAAEGGDLGDYKRGVLPKVMEDATFDLQPGQYTAPIRTKQGWLILEVTQHQKAGEAPLSEVQNQIQEEVGYSKMEPALRDYLAKLRNEAYINIRDGYVDTGATPNEQKIVQAAYTAPQPKKKQHTVRARFRPKAIHRKKETETAEVPAGVPTLDKVNEQKGSATQKPGKREKIRYGQAPRETLPAADTRTVDAGAGSAPSTQVAANTTAGSMSLTNAQGDVINNPAPDEQRTKTRFSDRGKKGHKEARTAKNQKFTPPQETPQQVATDKLEASALGLNGDTTKKKKVANPAKSGPKRRFSDEDKKKPQPQNQDQSGSSGAANTPATQAPANTGESAQPQS